MTGFLAFILGVPGWMITHPLGGIPLAALGYIAFVLIRPQTRCGCVRRKRRAGCGRCKGTGVRMRRPRRVIHAGAALAWRYWRKRQEGEEL
jgi:hypothetical protein